MARNGISYSDVKQMIDEMLSEGLNPTIAGLRERLGSGSFTTISEHLKRWRTERQEQNILTEGSPAPDNLNSMVQAVWRQAREDAIKDLESYKQEIQHTLDRAEAEKQQALEQAAATEEKNTWLNTRNEELLQAIRQLEKENGLSEAREEQLQQEKLKLESQLTQLNEKLESREQQWYQQKQKQKATAKEQQHAMNQQIQQLTENNRQALHLFEQQWQEERQRSEASEQHWIGQVDQLRRQLKEREQHWMKQEKHYQDQFSTQLKAYSDISQLLLQIKAQQKEQQQEDSGHRNSLNTLQQLLVSVAEMQQMQQQSLYDVLQITNQATADIQRLTVSLSALQKAQKKTEGK